MPLPHLLDDGQSVTLDLHGARVHEALDLAHALVAEAARRGRTTVRLIHGTSTADRGADRTIKGALLDALDRGAFDRHVISDFRADGQLTLGLAPARSSDPGRIRLLDLR